MRVIEVIYNWPAETFLQRHVQSLHEIKFPLQIVARHDHRSIAENASLGDLNTSLSVKIMPNFNHLGWITKFANLRNLTRASLQSKSLNWGNRVLLGYFERLRPDLIHFHDASLAASMCWIPAALGIPYTLSLRGSDIRVFAFQSPAQRDATRFAIEGASKVHAVCHSLGQNAVQLLTHDLDFSVIYTTLPISSALPSWRSTLEDREIHFISTGRLVWMKGFDHLLVALRHLRDRGMNARLTIVGVGPELDHLLYLRKRLNLESVVDLPGKFTYEQILDLFRRAHAYIQSSESEGLSNSVAEAMANGLPIFATDVGGTHEVIEDGVTGFLLTPLAPQDWAEKLTQVCDEVLIGSVRANAYQRARQFFSAKKHAHAFSCFFEQAINSRSS